MKNIAAILLFLGIFFYGMSFILIEKCETETGDIIRKEIQLDKFDQFKLNGSSKVIFTIASEQKVEIESSQNIIDLLNTEVKNDRWNISFEKCINSKKGLTIYISLPTIKEIALAGSGDIIGKSEIKQKKLSINLKGSGDINLEVDVDELNTDLKGSGDLSLKGNAKNQNIDLSGSGDYHSFNLASEKTNATLNGSGDIEISVKSSLSAKVKGSGAIQYKGDPSKVEKEVKGSGSVKAI